MGSRDSLSDSIRSEIGPPLRGPSPVTLAASVRLSENTRGAGSELKAGRCAGLSAGQCVTGIEGRAEERSGSLDWTMRLG
jgi:hypothetical protein